MTTGSAPFENKAIRPISISEQIVELLEARIRSGELKPGDKLPSEKELAQSMGVNRLTVSSVFNVLETRGLVRRRVGQGTFVKEVQPDVVSQSIERFMEFGDWSHRELLQLRRILEPEAAAIAASEATEEELQRLKEMLVKLEELAVVEDVDAIAEWDIEFHGAIAEATHSRLIVCVTAGLKKALAKWFEARRRFFPRDIIARTRQVHRKLLEAIASRDPQVAREEMCRHIHIAREADETLHRQIQVAREAEGNQEGMEAASFG